MSIAPRPGTVLAGYELQEVLGRGGMGVVYRALQQGLGRSVALKLLAPELAEDESFRARFLLESRLAASIDHPSIIPVYEAGEQDGLLYLAMRLVDGEDLGALLARGGRLAPERTLALLGQVGSALDAAHAQGLVHRDVKPANMLIAGGRHVYLSDFGLSKQASLVSGATATGQLLGTLAYIAPERIEGKPLDGRSDLYALACVAFECLTGELPYARAEEAALLYAHLAEQPPRASERVPELAAADDVLARGLAKTPGERQGSCEELIAELAAALGAADPLQPPAASAPPSAIVTLPLPPVVREVRKRVTVVLCDVGSVDGRRLDPELLRGIVPRLFTEIEAAVERHGGSTERPRGSSVLAVFGIPRLHEDDALRAVRAAVDAREALAALEGSSGRETGVALGVRIAIGTGEVVASDDPEQPPDLGDAADVFAGLDTSAQAGEITISEDTYRLVKDAVSVEPAEPGGFRLLGFAASAGHGLDSPIVGRRRERRLLEDAFERATSDRACQLFTMLGTAGVGKSRLVADFLAGVGDSATVVRGSCLSYGGGITYWPVKEVVRAAADIEEDDETEAAVAKIADVLGGGEDTRLIAGRIAETIGLADTSAGTEEETFWAVRELLEALARRHPLVVVFDDIHWGEPAFLDLIEHVADWSREVPILLLCMARPELLEKRPGWAGGKLNATSVLLEPLSGGECGELVANLLGGAPFAPRVRERIAEAAEGNPLFVEEMIAMLIDDGLLSRGDGGWRATADLTQVAIPPSIQALLAARLDRLASEERSAAECASVEGKVFHLGAVAEMTARPLAPTTRVLGTLARKELIRHDRTQLAGEQAFRFRHLLIRDVAYESLPKRARFGLHERFVDWLEPKTAERPGEYDEIVGYHLEQAYRLRMQLGLGDEASLTLAAHAGARLGAAGRRALARGDVAAAANLLGRAVSLLAAQEPERLELMLRLFEALRGTGQLTQARELLDEVVAGAEAQGDERIRAHAELHRLVLQTDTDPECPTDELQEVAMRAFETFERTADELGFARSWHALAEVHLTRCRWDDAKEALERALPHAERAGEQGQVTQIFTYLANAIFWGPTPASEGLRRVEEILARAKGHRIVEANVLCYLAGFTAMEGRSEEARALYARGRSIFEELGHTSGLAAHRLLSGSVELLLGDPYAAELELRSGCEQLEAMGETGILSSLVAFLAEALLLQNRLEEALHSTKVSEGASSADDVASNAGWRATRAKLLARGGQWAAAIALAHEAVALAETTDHLNLQGDALRALGDVLRVRGEPEAAAAALRGAADRYERKGNKASLAAVAVELDALDA